MAIPACGRRSDLAQPGYAARSADGCRTLERPMGSAPEAGRYPILHPTGSDIQLQREPPMSTTQTRRPTDTRRIDEALERLQDNAARFVSCRWIEVPRVVGGFPDRHSALMLVAARLRHIVSTRWGKRRWLVMEMLLNPAKEEDAAA